MEKTARGWSAGVGAYSVDSHQYFLWVASSTEEIVLANGWVPGSYWEKLLIFREMKRNYFTWD